MPGSLPTKSLLTQLTLRPHFDNLQATCEKGFSYFQGTRIRDYFPSFIIIIVYLQDIISNTIKLSDEVVKKVI